MSLVLPSGGLSADPPEIAAISAHNWLFWRGPLRAALLYCALSAGVAVALFTAAALVTPAGKSRTEPEPLPANPWMDIVRPFQIYTLSSEFGREPTTFVARRHRDGGGRIDTLTWGNLNPGDGEPTPYLRISLHRVGRESTKDGSFFVQMVRQAALFGTAITRDGVSDALSTRFGTFETADLTLDTGQTTSSCLGFRFAADAPALRISGFACGTPARPVDRQTLACTLDRLDLVQSGEDQELGRFFANAEARREPRCIPSRNAQPSPQGSWMGPTGSIPLRGVARKSRSAR
jgi:hypothetical protein